MLIEFSVGNYKSFKDIVTFSMVAANLASKNKELDISNIFNYKKSINFAYLLFLSFLFSFFISLTLNYI